MGGIKVFSQIPPPHVPDPRPFTWHLGGFYWISAAGVSRGGAWHYFYQALVLTPVEERKAQFKRAHDWKRQVARRVL